MGRACGADGVIRVAAVGDGGSGTRKTTIGTPATTMGRQNQEDDEAARAMAISGSGPGPVEAHPH